MNNIYIKESTIIQAYNYLTTTNLKYTNEFFHFLLLKHAGLSQHEFIQLTDPNVKEKISDAALKLSQLFLNPAIIQNKKSKYNFMNPFSMNSWGKQTPSESIKSWAPDRVINNVTGGGKQWKKILTDDGENPNTIKLKHNYLDFFENMTEKYPINSISIWLVRFYEFSNEVPLSTINNNFYSHFNISDEEKTFFFSNNSNISLEFSSEPILPKTIRHLIGNPTNQTEWLKESIELEINTPVSHLQSFDKFQNNFQSKNNTVKSMQAYKKTLSNADQIILMGPPGTSKSFIANMLSNEFEHTKRIQFHPQYSYQDFITGKILEEGNLKDKKGEFLTFLDVALSTPSENFLLIIEEINRANVSQVFGELIQLLDRGEKLSLSFNGDSYNYYLPSNLKIIGTMNTTDRTVGRIDYALKRRFYQIYFDVDYNILIDKVSVLDNSFSIADLLKKINSNLLSALNNKEMVIGHAIFLKTFVQQSETQKYVWDTESFSDLFNYVISPIIEDYCNGNMDLITTVLGEKLLNQLNGDEFVQAIQEFLTR